MDLIVDFSSSTDHLGLGVEGTIISRMHTGAMEGGSHKTNESWGDMEDPPNLCQDALRCGGEQGATVSALVGDSILTRLSSRKWWGWRGRIE